MMFWNIFTCLNLDLSTPNALSIIFLGWQWVRYYIFSIWVDSVLNGVMRKSFKGFPESPSSQPPSGRLAILPEMLEFDITYASCVVPGNRHLLRSLKHVFDRIKLRNALFSILKWIIFVNGLHWTNLLSISGQTSLCVHYPLYIQDM